MALNPTTSTLLSPKCTWTRTESHAVANFIQITILYLERLMGNVGYSFSPIFLSGCERNWSYFRRVQPIVVRQNADNRTLQLQSVFWKKTKNIEKISALESVNKKFKRMLALSGERETLFYGLNREPIISKDAFPLWWLSFVTRPQGHTIYSLEKCQRTDVCGPRPRFPRQIVWSI